MQQQEVEVQQQEVEVQQQEVEGQQWKVGKVSLLLSRELHS